MEALTLALSQRERGPDYTLSRSERGRVRGVTLIELLVVISIIMILTVVILPTMQPAAESRRMREAARALNVYMSSARNRAVETGRPCGVMFQRDAADNRFCSVLYQVEVPPPYGGDLECSTIVIPSGTNWTKTVSFPAGDAWSTLVQDGDILQLNYQGHRWKITTSGLSWTFSSSTATFPPSAPSGLPFQIFRAPVKSAADPLQLPTGVVVDLPVSGTDSMVNGMDAPEPRIVFSPNGSIHGCSDPIFLLLGQRDRPAAPTTVPPVGTAPPEEDLPNWIVPTNLWVSIGPQTGLVATSENYYVDPTQGGTDGIDWSDSSTWPINKARTYARQLQSMGGR